MSYPFIFHRIVHHIDVHYRIPLNRVFGQAQETCFAPFVSVVHCSSNVWNTVRQGAGASVGLDIRFPLSRSLFLIQSYLILYPSSVGFVFCFAFIIFRFKNKWFYTFMYLWKKAVSFSSAFILSIKSFICLQLHYKRFEKFDESFRVFFIPFKQVIFRRF